MERVSSLQEMSLLALTKQFDTFEKIISFCESSELLHNVSSVADNFWKETLRRFRKEHLVLMRGDLGATTLGPGAWYHFVKSLETGVTYKYHATNEYRNGARIIKPRSLSFTYEEDEFDIEGLLPKPNTRGYFCEGISYLDEFSDEVFEGYIFHHDEKEGYLNLLRWIANRFHWIIQLEHSNVDDFMVHITIDHVGYDLPAKIYNKESLVDIVIKHGQSLTTTDLQISLDLRNQVKSMQHEYFHAKAIVI